MKYLILADNFAGGGGAGEIARVEAERLAHTHEVEVLTANAPQSFKAENYRVFVYDLRYPYALRNYLGIYHPVAIKILRNHLQNSRPDEVMIHNLHTNWSYYSLSVLKKLNIKSVLIFHDVATVTPYVKLCNISYQSEEGKYKFNYRYSWWRHLRDAKFAFNPLRNLLIRRYIALASETYAVSKALADFLRANKVSVNGVRYNKLPDGFSPSQIYNNSILFGGRLSTSKGALAAVRYLNVLKSNYHLTPDLLVVGTPGVITKKMQELAAELEVQEQLRILGWLNREEYAKILRDCGVVIVPSLCFDSLPTMILEAMHAARPVVATIFGGSSELVEDEVSGFIVNPYEVEKFAGRIAELLFDRSKSQAMGLAAYERVRKHFTLPR